MRSGTWVLIALSPLLAAGDCGPTPCPAQPAPITADRARQLDPTLETGLAVSTTYVFGDCRPAEGAAEVHCGENPRCARQRRPLSVFILPVNQSVPIDPACDPALAVSDLETHAVFSGVASEAGELAIPLEPGGYTLYVANDDRCAVCGLTEEAGACTVEITAGQILARDLVLDRSSR